MNSHSQFSAGMPAAPPCGCSTEDLLLEIYREFLGRHDCNSKDNFFDLGGDSRKALELVWRIRQSGLHLEVRSLLEHPDISSLAQHIDMLSAFRASKKEQVDGSLEAEVESGVI